MKKTILIADDKEKERQCLQKLLEDHYELIMAPDGMTALELYREHSAVVSGAVLDNQMMHEMDGRLYDKEKDIFLRPQQFYGTAVARNMRAEGFEGPIVIRSYSDPEYLKYELGDTEAYCHEKGEVDDSEILLYLSKHLE